MKKKVKTTNTGTVSNIKKMILTIAIALVFVFFIAYAVQTSIPAPTYEEYCGEIKTAVVLDTKELCESSGGKWNAYDRLKTPEPEITTGWCERDYHCRNNYDQARTIYENYLFYFNILIGISAIILSFFISVEAVGAGFMAGGTINLIYGTIRNWQNLPDIYRTILLGIALTALVWVGYKKLKD